MNPMKPKDPNDVVPGWTYAISLSVRQSKAEYGDNAKDTTDTIGYEHTLADAQCTLGIEAELVLQRTGVHLRPSSKNRFYSSGELEFVELCILPIEDPAHV
jgi:hypothetical protein